MKILVLNYEFPPVGGGGGRASADLCRELVAHGHEIRVLTSHAKDLPREEKIDGYLILRVSTGRKDYSTATFSSMLRYVLSGFFTGFKLIRSWKPDLLHVHFAVPTGALGRILSGLTRVPYVLTAHLGDVPGGVPSKTDRWFRAVYPFTPTIWKGAAAVVAVSKYTKELAEVHYDIPIEIIPNGVELDLRSDWDGDVHQPPVIVFAGRFQPQKNLSALIQSLEHLQDLEWICKLVGDGPQRRSLEEMTETAGLSHRIEFTGWVNSDEVWGLLEDSDILAMPSLSEGLPVIGIHALAQGLAIVAYQAGGLVDLVEQGVNGRLCPIGDQACFESGLRWCLSDRQKLTELKNASRKLADRFDIRQVTQEYEDIFFQVARS